MAWEEESIDSGADFEEVGGKKSPLKMIIIVVVGLVVLGGGGYAVWKFLLSGDDAPPEEEEAAQEEPQPEVESEVGFKVDLEKFTLNLADGGANPRFMVASLSLEVSSEELKIDLTDVEDTKLYMIKTRDTILTILRAKTFKEMNEPDSSKEIAKEILFKLNRIYKTGEVRNVYFRELMVQ